MKKLRRGGVRNETPHPQLQLLPLSKPLLPYLHNTPPWFAFLFHGRNDDDFRSAGLITRRFASDEEDYYDKLMQGPPLVCGEIAFGVGGIRGEVVGVRILHTVAKTVKPGWAREATLAGLMLAAQRGAAVVGLGALTAPLTAGGKWLLKHVPAGVTLTTGNAYTALVVQQNIIEASEQLGLGTSARVAILGATGSVGGAVSRLLVDYGFRDLILIGRKQARVEAALPDLVGQARFTDGLECLSDANITVLLTSDRVARVAPHHFASGSVVIDCAQPQNVCTSDYPNFCQHGIRIAEGGVVEIPGFACTLSPFNLNPGTFACLAETYLMSREGMREHSVGVPTPDAARTMGRVAERHGVQPRRLHFLTDGPETSRVDSIASAVHDS